MADALRLIRRTGYHTLPVPLPETMFAKALWAQSGGALREGALSLAPTGADQSITIERSGRGFMLQGRAARIPWAAQVGHVLVYARDSSGAGHLVLLQSAAASMQPHRNLANEARDTLLLDSVEVPQRRYVRRREPVTKASCCSAL